MRADSGHHHCTRAIQGGGGPLNDRRHEISRPATTERAWIGPTNTAAAANLGRRIFMFSGHFRPTHTSFPPFLDPLNSFPWSLFADSSPFERYDKNKVCRLLDRVFRPPSNLWTKVRVLMCSWSLGISIDMWFVNFGLRFFSFPFFRLFRVIT